VNNRKEKKENVPLVSKLVVRPVIGFYGGATIDSTFDMLLESNSELFLMVRAHALKEIEADDQSEGPFKDVTGKMVDEAKSVAIGNLKKVLQEYKNMNLTKDAALEKLKKMVVVKNWSSMKGNTVGDATYGATNMYEVQLDSDVKNFYTSEE